MTFPRALGDPRIPFATPEGIENATRLTAAEKRAMLRQWKDQLTKLLIADDEGMVRHDPGTGSADWLGRVTTVMARLGP